MAIAAFFDLDLTLLTVNSGSLWIRRERRLGRLSLRQVTEGMVLLAGYRLNLVDIEASIRKALAVYRGQAEEAIRAWTKEWYHQEVAHLVSTDARAALEEHREAGHRLVLLTSSSPYVSAAVTEHLGLDAWISSTYEVRDGLLTGEPVLPLCYGPGKVAHAEAYAARERIDLTQSCFYTDSYSDLAMLLCVGQPRAVNPDLRLRLYARWRGWPVLEWR
jgi:HAD superfamily hydrolase (TIGR01490 family)